MSRGRAGAQRLTAARVAVDPVRSLAGSAAAAQTPAGAVRREMLGASCLTADDARLILARRTSELLEGGRLARLAPARRQRLDRLGTTLGLRAFDASLVIAIAQDAARNAEAVEEASGRLALVRASRRAAWSGAWWAGALGVALGGAGVMALIRWVVGTGV